MAQILNKEQFSEKFRIRLRTVRKRRRLTQEELGKLAGISAVTVSHMERHAVRATPSIYTLYAMADALDVPPSYLIDL